MPSILPKTPQGQTLTGSPLESDTPLIVHIDFKSPYAYLAVEPTRRMLAEEGLLADWRPFVLNIGSYLGTAKLANDGKVEKQNRSQEQWSGVKYAYFDCRRYANLADQTIRGTVKIWDTNLPAIGMWWLKLHQSLAQQNDPKGLLQRYIDAVYLPFWRREFDAEDIEAVVGALQHIDAPLDGFRDFAESQGNTFNHQYQEDAFASGVYGVPTYVLPGQADETGTPSRFFGREHLPRIRWALTGAKGPGPDVAYNLAPSVSPGSLEKCASQPGIAQTKQLSVYFDFKSPNSYLALAGLLALKEDGATLQWHPFDHKPLNRPASPMDSEDRSTMHRRIRGEYVVADIQRYAPHSLGDIHRATDCSLANMGLLWLKTQSSPGVETYVEAVFAALWLDDLDITKAPLIRDLVARAAGPVFDSNEWNTFLEGTGETALAAAKANAAAAGVSYAPTMTLGDEPFQGRAQLPLIRARLSAGI
jgi:2-hydroxychromene-2-carboxylate isomerase